MSTYLQLCQDLRQEAGISGVGPTTVVGQAGQLKKIIDWIPSAWNDIQSNRDQWQFMRTAFSFDTINGAALYERDQVAVLNLADIFIEEQDSFRIYLKSAGVATEGRLEAIPYNDFRAMYEIGSTDDNSPSAITVTPQGELKVGPAPDGIYTISGEFYRTPQVLSANADIPIMPTRFHRLIMLRALIFYAQHEEANSIQNSSMYEYDNLLRDLERRQLPVLNANAGPLA